MWYSSSPNVTSASITIEQLEVYLFTVFLDINEALGIYIDAWEEEWIDHTQADKVLEICDLWMHRYKNQFYVEGLQKVIDMLNLAKELHTCVEFNF